MKEGKLKKIIKIDWTIFYSKPRIQILGILIFLDIMLLFFCFNFNSLIYIIYIVKWIIYFLL